MKPYRPPGREVYKLRINLPDKRRRNCSCGTASLATARAIGRFVQTLFDDRRFDVLEAIVSGRCTLVQAYDHRENIPALLADLASVDLEPYVERWFAERQKARKGATVAPKYYQQVRVLVVAGKRFPVAEFTPQRIRTFLRGLKVEEPTKNRYKAAVSSFAEFLVEENVIDRNPVRDVKGFSEGAGNFAFYELADAKRMADAMPANHAAAFALACEGMELQTLQRLRVRDVDLSKQTVFADGSKSDGHQVAWRRRMMKLVWPWSLPLVRPQLADKMPDALVFEWLDSDKVLLAAIADAATATQLPRLTLHQQRHTCAVNMLRAGYRPEVVAAKLGHSDTSLVWKRYGRYLVDERDYARRTETEPSAAPSEHPGLKENVSR